MLLLKICVNTDYYVYDSLITYPILTWAAIYIYIYILNTVWGLSRNYFKSLKSKNCSGYLPYIYIYFKP